MSTSWIPISLCCKPNHCSFLSEHREASELINDKNRMVYLATAMEWVLESQTSSNINHMPMLVYIYIYIYICVCVCVCACVCVCVWGMCVFVCMNIYIYIYIYDAGYKL